MDTRSKSDLTVSPGDTFNGHKVLNVHMLGTTALILAQCPSGDGWVIADVFRGCADEGHWHNAEHTHDSAQAEMVYETRAFFR